ncbi:hypothetical protein AB4Z17_28615 [Paenibacillus sp. TAF43_2]|uniref:hypothetical protein n=1 Tax=Paenibacillus sp. TAF43_2 TaxID=3233069 RepID=UPI003F994C0B
MMVSLKWVCILHIFHPLKQLAEASIVVGEVKQSAECDSVEVTARATWDCWAMSIPTTRCWVEMRSSS